MKRKTIQLISMMAWMLTSCFYACSDVLLEDISDDQVTLLAPANNVVSNTQTQTFWWEALEDADRYILQIVSPSFDSIVQLVAEVEITEGQTHEMVLNDGVYQWAVIGSNGPTQTMRNPYNLTIESDSSGDLSQQIVLLVSPEDGLVTTELDIDFLWQGLEQVDQYHFQLASPDFSNSSFILEDQRMSEDLFLATLSEGNYQWRVRGENDFSVTPYSLRSLTIDLTAPDAPILNQPANGDSLALPIILAWTSDPSAMMDTLLVYPDSLVSTPIIRVPLSTSSFTFNNQTANQCYFWRVRSRDAAGNLSSYSSVRKFFVEN
ncbi:MAG: hypothetical protein AAGD05_10380 [Bacteroidota bacterium]